MVVFHVYRWEGKRIQYPVKGVGSFTHNYILKLHLLTNFKIYGCFSDVYHDFTIQSYKWHREAATNNNLESMGKNILIKDDT